MAVPDKAYSVWRIVRQTGAAPDGYVGGRRFANREQKLPVDGRYREYDVDPRPADGRRNGERIVVNAQAGFAWYTPDHYETFFALEEKGGD